jgi:hypothetical protein
MQLPLPWLWRVDDGQETAVWYLRAWPGKLPWVEEQVEDAARLDADVPFQAPFTDGLFGDNQLGWLVI